MKLKYKLVKVHAPFCPICDEQLGGNNSDFMPYKCSCGIWKRKRKGYSYSIVDWELTKAE